MNVYHENELRRPCLYNKHKTECLKDLSKKV